jgi:hypothetical protein
MATKKFRDLTPEDIQFIKDAHYNNPSTVRDELIKEKFKMNISRARTWVMDLGLSKNQVNKHNPYKIAAYNRNLEDSKYYIITAAQNATKVHDGLWGNIIAYKEKLGASLHVIPYNYKNPTSRKEKAEQEDENWWDERTVPYLDLGTHTLHKNLVLLSSNKISATSGTPLAGKEGVTGQKSCIIGHPRQQLKSLPVLKGKHKKRILTTGACTIKDYSLSNAGFLGEFHHILGFAIVEIRDNNIFHVRQVSADENGDFIDICMVVKDGVVTKGSIPEAIIFGDLHAGFHDEQRVDIAMEIYSRMKPKNVVLHDVFDGYSINPHEKDSPIKRLKMHKQGKLCLATEIEDLMNLLSKFNESFENIHIVKSNHDLFLDRYINGTDWRKDLINAEIYFELAAKAVSAENGLIPCLIEEYLEGQINCLGYNDSLVIANHELALHGDKGSNGSKGSPRSFSRLPDKCIVAHGHGTWVLDGAMQVGTCTKIQEGYAVGLSSWIWADAILHPNGKAQLLIWEDNYTFTTLLD